MRGALRILAGLLAVLALAVVARGSFAALSAGFLAILRGLRTGALPIWAGLFTALLARLLAALLAGLLPLAFPALFSRLVAVLLLATLARLLTGFTVRGTLRRG